jgi:ubiquitin-conjugating enzyme E2 variant
VLLFALLVTNANQIHKWTHMNRSEVPSLVRALQQLLVLQTPRHHARHHSGARNTHYCVITNFVNPLLEELSLWARLERLIERMTGVKRRNEADELALLGMAPPPRAASDPKASMTCVRCAAPLGIAQAQLSA